MSAAALLWHVSDMGRGIADMEPHMDLVKALLKQVCVDIIDWAILY